MVVVDEEGEVTTTDGVGALMEDPKGEFFPWRLTRRKPRSSSFEQGLRAASQAASQAASGPAAAVGWNGLCALAIGFGLGFVLATAKAKRVG